MNSQIIIPPPLPPCRQDPPRVLPILNAAEIEAIIEEKCGSVYVAEKHGEGKNKVYILPEVFQELKNMVSYGRRSPMNKSEQKYVGEGHFFREDDDSVNIVISHFIPILTTNRTSISASNLGPNGEMNPGLNFLEYHREEFRKYEKQFNEDAYGYIVDPFLEFGSSEYVLEGHTHPDLGVFLSNADRRLGAVRAASVPVCSFVCDPIRKEMLGCIGKDLEYAEVIVYDRLPESTVCMDKNDGHESEMCESDTKEFSSTFEEFIQKYTYIFTKWY